MKDRPFVGVWVDHRHALLFWANEQAEVDVQELESEYQEEGEPGDAIRGPGGGGVAHASIEHRHKEQLKHYYRKLDHVLRPAQEIMVFGPGQAKKELAAFLEQDKGSRARLRGVENADKKLTHPQMAAMVKKFFELPRRK
jgi:hypothetical protein